MSEDPQLIKLKTTNEPGRWELLQNHFKHLPVHISLIHTGKVIGFGGSGNDEKSFKKPHPAEIFDTKTKEVYEINQTLDGDLFCAGHAFLEDGKLLVAGGTRKYDKMVFNKTVFTFSGLDQSYLFDPESETWFRTPDMNFGRWYPTLVVLGDGTIFNVAGLTKHFPWAFLRTIELYRPGLGWKKLSKGKRWLPLYPRLHLLPDGDVFYSGSYNTHYTFPFSLKAFPTSRFNVSAKKWKVVGYLKQSQREEGASIMLPLIPPDYKPRIMLIGGGYPTGSVAVADSEIIDLSKDNPTWERTITPMKNARYYCYAVILPTKDILVTGGREGNKKHTVDMDMESGLHEGAEERNCNVKQTKLAIREAEMFDFEKETWSTVASMKVDRLYHSSALLLPDGSVMTAGSNPARREDEHCIEIYYPWYFDNKRPFITDSPKKAFYGNQVKIGITSDNEITELAVIRPASTTHCMNPDQRFVGLEFERKEEEYIFTVPTNPNLLPPGYYLLFAIDNNHVPSEGIYIQIININ